jgi:hypothetical protein
MTNPLPPNSPVPVNSAASGEQLTRDEANLNTLATCWYVYAVLILLPSCGGIIYIILGIIFGLTGAATNDAGGAAGGLAFGGIFACIGLVFIAIFAGLSYLYYRCGKNLKERRGMTLCYVAAVLACFQIPLGTILGIFTFVVLSKPGAKALFR